MGDFPKLPKFVSQEFGVFKANKKAGLIQNKQGYFFTLKYRK
jgi:hypothetical protein